MLLVEIILYLGTMQCGTNHDLNLRCWCVFVFDPLPAMVLTEVIVCNLVFDSMINSWQDEKLASKFVSNYEKQQLYREIASAAESGWDFSSRWMRYYTL